MKNRTRRRPKSRFLTNRSFQVESLEDRRLLAADLEYVIPLGGIGGVFISGLGGDQPLIEEQSRWHAKAEERNADIAGFEAPDDGVGYYRRLLNVLDGRPHPLTPGDTVERIDGWNHGVANGVESGIHWDVNWNGGKDPGNFAGLLHLGAPESNRSVTRNIDTQLTNDYRDYDLIIVAGYSLGGDTALSIAHSMYFGETREVDILAVIDPSESAFPQTGSRAALDPGEVKSNVHTFFNRWQTNYMFPRDLGTNGIVTSDAEVNDQQKQNDRKNWDGSFRKRGCDARDYLSGFCKLFGPTKTSRIDHKDIANDPYVRRQFSDLVSARLADIEQAPDIIAGFESGSGTRSDVFDQTFSWQVYGQQGDVYLEILDGPEIVQPFSKVDPSGEIDFNDWGPGSYEFTLFAEGYNGKVETYRTNVVDDDLDAPIVQLTDASGALLSYRGSTQSHGVDNGFRWLVTDPSGFSGTANVTRNGQSVGTESIGSTQRFDLNDQGLGTFSLSLTATDADQDDWPGDSSSKIVQTSLTVTNAAPTVTTQGLFEVTEGDLVSLSAVGADIDPGDTETLQYAWDLDGDGQYDDATGQDPVLLWAELASTGVDDDGSYAISVRVTDTFGETAYAASILSIANAAPSIVSIQTPPNASENESVVVTGSFVDAGPSDTHSVTIDWGDGTTSLATVDALSRTFSASHLYPDDQPTNSEFDDYTLSVSILDDDGGVSGDEIRTATIDTSSTGGIEFPSFSQSLPSNTSGLLIDAATTVVPSAVTTESEIVDNLPHRHTIDYPGSGSPFTFPAVQTSISNAAQTHGHTIPAQTQKTTLTSATRLAQFRSGASFAVARPRTTDGAHLANSAWFDTTAKFFYRPDSIVYERPGSRFRDDDPDVSLIGSASVTSNGRVLLTDAVPNQRGAFVIRQQRRVEEFTIDVDLRIGGGSGADGMSIGYGPLSTGSSFGEEGRSGRQGLWVLFDTLDNGGSDRAGIEIWYNGQLKAGWTRSLSANWERATVRIYKNSNGSSTVGVDFPGYSEFRKNIGTFSPQSSWRFGFGGRTGSYTNQHGFRYLRIRDDAPPTWFHTQYESAVNRVVFPQFESSRGGNLFKVEATVNRRATTTNSVGPEKREHTHNVNLAIEDFSFPQIVPPPSDNASATVDHVHTFEFSPVRNLYAADDPFASRFLDNGPEFVPLAPLTTSTVEGHAHDVDPASITFETSTLFRYDATRATIRVHNANPTIHQIEWDAAVDEQGVATLNVDFSDLGPNDTHQAHVDWGDGQSSLLTIPFGQTSLQANHLYLDDDPTGTDGDTYTVTVRIFDDDQGEVLASRDIFVGNIAPTLAVPADFTVDEGTAFRLPRTTFIDAGLSDSHTVTIDWQDGSVATPEVIQEAALSLVDATHVYTDDGTYIAQISVADDDGALDSGEVTVTVNNIAPRIDSLAGALSGAEGDTLSFQAIASDPGADPLTYTWDFGDGTATQSGIDLTQVSHTYAGDGVYNITLTVADDAGASSSSSLVATLSDVAARMLVFGPSSVDEGTIYALTLGEIQDPGNDAYEIEINWGDGFIQSYTEATTVNHQYAGHLDSTTIQVTLIDSSSARHSIASIPVSIANVAPRIDTLDAPSSTVEGEAVSFSATATDPGDDAITYTWDFGDGASVSGADLTNPVHAFADNGVFLVTLRTQDDFGGSTTKSLSISVGDQAPTTTVSGDSVAIEGAEYFLSLNSIIDPGDDTVSQLIVDWGDGSVVTYGESDPLVHVYEEGPVTADIQVTIIDEDGWHAQSQLLTVNVDNAAPEQVAITGDLVSQEGSLVSFTATAIDPAGPFDPLVYEWDFGDGSATVYGEELTSASHRYLDDGNYALTLRVQDDDGGYAIQTQLIEVQNTVPTIMVSSNPTVAEGEEYVLSLGPTVDAGQDTVTSIEVDWGDGTTEVFDYNDPVRHVYTNGPLNTSIAISLIDEDGSHPVAGRSVSVTNVAPTIAALQGDTGGLEGQELGWTATSEDPSGTESLTYAWDFGDGSSPMVGINLSSVTHVFADNGTYDVRVTVSDGHEESQATLIRVDVDNAAPNVSIEQPPTIVEGGSISLILTDIIDPGTDEITHWIVDWGDGSQETFTEPTNLSHQYLDGPFSPSIELSVFDEDGFHENVASVSGTIENVAPELNFAVVEEQVAVNELFFLSGTISDLGAMDEQTVLVDWGDGSSSVLDSFTGASFDFSHSYTASGTYAINATVSDEDGASNSSALNVSALPTLSIVSWENGTETSISPTTFRLALSGTLQADLDIQLDLSGTATSGTDFELPNSLNVTIPMGESESFFTLSTLDDDLVEGPESIVASVGQISVPSVLVSSTQFSASSLIIDNDPDSDLDGIDESTEQLAPNNGDGNLDGIQDDLQSNVSSLPNAVDGQYVTLVTDSAVQLKNVLARRNLSAVIQPEGVDFPYGFVEFEIQGLDTGASTTVSLLYQGSTSTPLAYYKYGPTHDDPTPHWYDFSFDPVTGTGAIISGDEVTLHFVDGLRGDSDLTANGVIEDPGGLAVVNASPNPLSAGGPYSVSQGENVSFSALFASGNDGISGHYEWDLDYDFEEFDVDSVGQDPNVAGIATGTRTVAVRFTPDDGESLLAFSSLTVLNAHPIAQSDEAETEENAAASINVVVNDFDIAGAPVSILPESVTIESAETEAGAVVSLATSVASSVSGEIVFDPSTDFDFLRDGESVLVKVSYSITDNERFELTDSGTLSLTIHGKNDAPVATSESIEVKEDSGVQMIAANFIDNDFGDLHSLVIESPPAIGTLIHDGGSFTYKYDRLFEYLAKNESASDQFVYSVTDAVGDTSTATVNIQVVGENDLPIVHPLQGSVGEDSAAVTLVPNFEDVDSSDTHEVVFDSSQTLGDVALNNAQQLAYSPNGAFDYLALGEQAIDTFTFSVIDSSGGRVNTDASITVNGLNDVPSVSAVFADVNESGPAVSIAAEFSDVDASDTHVFAIDSSATLGSVTNNDDGTFTYDPNGAFEYLGVDETATDSFQYSVDDGRGGNSASNATIRIAGSNDAPTITVDLEDAVTNEGQTAHASGTWAELDVTDSLTIESSIGSASLNDDGTWSWSLNTTDGPADSKTVTVTISDNHGASASTNFELTVKNVAPEITAFVTSATYTNPGELDGSLVLTNIGQETAAYQNSYGYYHFNQRGKPTNGKIVWANMKENVGNRYVLSDIDPTSVKFFMIPDGQSLNIDLANETDVTFLEDTTGDWFAQTLDGQQIVGRGAHAFFSNRRLNSDRRSHVTDNSNDGNQNWEDLVGGGDRDFDDANVDVVRSAMVTVSGTYQDPGKLDEHSLAIRWDDGTETIVLPDDPRIDRTTGTFEVTHHYVTGGIFSIDVIVEDDDGGSANQTTTGVVSGVRLTQDGELQVIGSTENDRVELSLANRKRSVDVRLKLDNEGWKSSQYDIDNVERTLIYLLEGDDRLNISQDSAIAGINNTVHGGRGVDRIVGGRGADEIYGGPGDDRIWGQDGSDYLSGGEGGDRIYGGRGDDVLLGGIGDDRLWGDRGRDVIVGGSGGDNLRGGRDQDILVAGVSLLGRRQLFNVRHVWSSETSYEDRVSSLSVVDGALEPQVQVVTDEQVDSVRGEGSRDYFFAEFSGDEKDQLHDLLENELAEDLVEISASN